MSQPINPGQDPSTQSPATQPPTNPTAPYGAESYGVAPYGVEPAPRNPTYGIHPANLAAYPAPYPAPAHYQPTPPPGWRAGYEQVEQDLGYHRLALADPKHTWWKPLVEGLLGVVIYLVLFVVLAVGFYIALAAGIDPTMGPELFLLGNVDTFTTLAMESPAVFAFLFGSVALMFPALWCARLIMGPRPWGLIHSVAGRMRWLWLLTCTGVAALIFVGVPTLLELAVGSTFEVNPTAQGGALTALLVLGLIIVPIQAYAEELVFRGYLLQTLGRWLKHPAWAIFLPAPLFMIAHGYDLWGQLSVLVMAVAAGYITWRTGGLEAAIALHIINNLVAMGFGIFGLADPFLEEGSSPLGLLSSAVTQGIFVALVLWLAHKQGIQRTRHALTWAKTPSPGTPAPVDTPAPSPGQ